MVYCNRSSLVISVNDSEYIHFCPTFQLPPTLSHCKCKPFIKSIEFCLFHYKCWLNHLSAILNGKLLKFLRILITAVCFKDLKWTCKTMYCISCSMVCKIIFCPEFRDIPDKAGRKTRRRRTQAIAKRYAFHANAITLSKIILQF